MGLLDITWLPASNYIGGGNTQGNEMTEITVAVGSGGATD